MPYMTSTAGNGAAPLIIPVGGPPGPQGRSGADSSVPGPVGPQGVPGRNGEQGQPGAGAVTSRVASVNVSAWTAVIADGATGCAPADPSNPAHRGQVLGIAAGGGIRGARISIQNVGDLMGPVASFAVGAPLFVATGGALVATPPTSGWRQIVGVAVSTSQIVVGLGEARVVSDAGPALVLPDGSFASRATPAQVAALSAIGFLTPADIIAVLEAWAAGLPDQSVAAPGKLCRSGEFLMIKSS